MSHFNWSAQFKISILSPIKIGSTKFSLTASCAESIGKDFPAFTMPAFTPFFLCATFNKLLGQTISLFDNIINYSKKDIHLELVNIFLFHCLVLR